MDLKNFVPKKDNLVVTLELPQGEGTKVLTNKDGTSMTITILSPFSKEHKAILSDIAESKLAEDAGKNKTRVTIQEAENLELEAVARSIVEWNITWDGKHLKEVDYELAKEICEVFWIKDLITRAKTKTLDFMTA